ncbi:MAG: zinc ribbon domain-containing protein [Candidatus Thorarchaeota archaeon]|nr:zinc ribbon domain-containing protein [Candidatus Thorarchaeota archaeon]
MTNDEIACTSCGANIAPGEKNCPHCGKTVEKTTTTQGDSSTYTTEQREDGSTHIEFGDGKTGVRPIIGVDGVRVSEGFRVKEGKTDEIKCPRCMTVQTKKNEKCVKCGASLKKRRFRFSRA